MGGGGVSAGDDSEGVSSVYVKMVKVGGVTGKVGGGMEQCEEGMGVEVEQGMGRVGTRREVEQVGEGG